MSRGIKKRKGSEIVSMSRKHIKKNKKTSIQKEEKMELLPQQIKNKLKENHIATMKDDTVSHKPVVKYFTPFGAATWLISEIDDENMMFGLCDLGQGFLSLAMCICKTFIH